MDAGLVRIVAPMIEPVGPEAVMAEARLEDTDELDLIEIYISAAREHVESFIKRSLLRQTWELTVATFPDVVPLWRGPLLRLSQSPQIEPVTVAYLDDDNNSQAWTGFQLLEHADPPILRRLSNGSWPATGAVITYTAGYGELPTDVPAPLRLAITRLAAFWYDVRLPIPTESAKADELPFMVSAMLHPYRCIWPGW